MSDETELKHRGESSRGGLAVIVIFVLLPVLYLLSPPWVAMLLGPNYYDKAVFSTLYAPLIVIAEKAEPVNDFYDWYFTILGVL